MNTSQSSEAINFLPPIFPEKWANEWGEDEVGLWMALAINHVRQVFRWILPGTFLMGSPDSEADRLDTEVQHQVTLTEGYWLADTACTQALWRTVMDENPARFNEDENHSVELVSWNDVQRFLNLLNDLVPGLKAGLPSEAQWEYACRAGTITPFSFGDNITPEQVNYDGDYPYAGGKKGKDRERTVPVKSLPVNPWGLYEMHGNVWEWCQDWWGDYSTVAETNPTGLETGIPRVLRGGSWFSDGRRTRSARRHRYEPDARSRDIGFRFAPGQAKSRAVEPQIAVAEQAIKTTTALPGSVEE